MTWVLERVADAGLLKGKTVGIDPRTLEMNAALRSVVRRDTGAGDDEFLRGLAAASGIPTPTRADFARRPEGWQGLQQGLDASEGPGREDHEDERRPDGPGPQGRARGRPGDRRGRRRHRCRMPTLAETTTMVETQITRQSRSKRCCRRLAAWPRW